MATQYTAGLVQGQKNTAAIMNSIGAAWESYTPTLTQPGAIGKTVNYAKYAQIQKIVVAVVQVTVTGAGTATSAVEIGLPINASTTTGLRVGTGTIYDASTNTMYNSSMVLAGATNRLWFVGDWSGGNVFGAVPAIGIANGDQISFMVIYEAA